MFVSTRDTVSIESEVNLQSLVFQLVNNVSDDALFQLIMDIDTQVADYDFTKKLRDAFDEEIRQEDANG